MSRRATLRDAISYFSDRARCHEIMLRLRWPEGKPVCPVCGAEKLGYLQKSSVWKCYANHPRARFSLKTGTIFAESPLGLETWFPMVWVVVNPESGVSSWELHRALGVTQKTAWFSIHRIRLALERGPAMDDGEDWLMEIAAPRSVPVARPERTDARPLRPREFASGPEFRRFRMALKEILKITKPELARRIDAAARTSRRFGNPDAPGRKAGPGDRR